MKKRLIITEEEKYRILNLHKSKLIKEENDLSEIDDYAKKKMSDYGFKMESKYIYTKVHTQGTYKIEFFQDCQEDYFGFKFFENGKEIYKGCPDACWVWLENKLIGKIGLPKRAGSEKLVGTWLHCHQFSDTYDKNYRCTRSEEDSSTTIRFYEDGKYKETFTYNPKPADGSWMLDGNTLTINRRSDDRTVMFYPHSYKKITWVDNDNFYSKAMEGNNPLIIYFQRTKPGGGFGGGGQYRDTY